MQYQKIINLLGNTSNELSKFRTKNWVESNNKSGGTYNANSQVKFKNSMLRSSLCDYSDAYILVRATMTVSDTSAEGKNQTNRKNIIIKNCAPFTTCIS